LEVKGSKFRLYGNSINGRWEWTNLLGQGRKPKRYDRLILVGDRPLGAGITSPFLDTVLYYFFDVPYEWVLDYTLELRSRTLSFAYAGGHSAIGYEFWTKFASNPDQLIMRYGKKADA